MIYPLLTTYDDMDGGDEWMINTCIYRFIGKLAYHIV
jgi:hypothetical protein